MRLFNKEINLDGEINIYDDVIVHSGQVALLMGDFAWFLGLDNQMEDDCTIAGYFHDMGKLFVDKKYLGKKGKLNTKEFQEIMKHVDYTVQYTKPILNHEVWRGVSEHHEDYDGGGYPLGKKGESISFIGRMLRIVDMYVALRTKRVYKETFSYQKSIEIMKLSINKYDPVLIENFFRFLNMKHESKQFHYQNVSAKSLDCLIGLTVI